jgi:hypothetical protein
MRAGHAVTPSRIVDAVWHLHLTYSRDYWEDFCGNVLGRELHHEPGSGADGEAEQYHRQYRRTCAAYADIFGREPPEAYWPGGEASNAPIPAPKPFNFRRVITLLAAAFFVGVILPATCGIRDGALTDASADLFGIVLIGVAIVTVIMWMRSQRRMLHAEKERRQHLSGRPAKGKCSGGFIGRRWRRWRRRWWRRWLRWRLTCACHLTPDRAAAVAGADRE